MKADPRYDFVSDNTAPAAPEAMAALWDANRGFIPAYGADPFTAEAADLVRGLLDTDAEVRFVASGTAANAIALAALCRSNEAVLAHEHAHILKEEAGAPAYFGQGLSVVGLPGAAGRIDPSALQSALTAPESASRQSPAALSLTNTTEYGGLYTVAAMRALVGEAKRHGLAIHLDGARIANAAAAGFELKQIARLGVDIMVIGGSKAGMPPTEAMVIFNHRIARRFDSRLKQAGQLPSKGRFLAAPFIGMLRDGAFLRHAAHANAMAARLAAAQPFPLRHPVEANGVFIDMDDASLARLRSSGWAALRVHDGSVRFMCSWASTLEIVERLSDDLSRAA